MRGFERNGDFSPTTKLATGLVNRFDQFPLPSLPVNHERKSDDWLRKVSESQRNTGFSDRERNFGGFWGGLYRQQLNTAQSLGLVILIVFYVVLFVGLVAQHWPPGPAPVWQKIFHGYGPYLLLSLPLLLFFLLLQWRMRRRTKWPLKTDE